MAVKVINPKMPQAFQETVNDGPEKEAKQQQPSRKLPTDRISFQKQLDILRAYALGSNGGTTPVHYKAAAEMVKMSAATVPLMNTFIVDNGFVEKSGNDFIPHRALIDFTQAYSWNPETAPKKLAPLIRTTWFGDFMLKRLQFRSMTEDEMIAELAQQVGAPPDCKAQIKTLIDYTEVSGLVKRDGTQLSLGETANSAGNEQPRATMEKAVASDSTEIKSEQSARPAGTVTTGFMAAGGRVQLHVNIDVSMEEMSGWTPDRISAFFTGLAQVLAAKKGTEQV